MSFFTCHKFRFKLSHRSYDHGVSFLTDEEERPLCRTCGFEQQKICLKMFHHKEDVSNKTSIILCTSTAGSLYSSIIAKTRASSSMQFYAIARVGTWQSFVEGAKPLLPKAGNRTANNVDYMFGWTMGRLTIKHIRLLVLTLAVGLMAPLFNNVALHACEVCDFIRPTAPPSSVRGATSLCNPIIPPWTKSTLHYPDPQNWKR